MYLIVHSQGTTCQSQKLRGF
uniref:Uncharacterized protein n=1 Tax=Anguilla anguilla TaxID=7936 RepID=A0A0E9UCH2_ANGAN